MSSQQSESVSVPLPASPAPAGAGYLSRDVGALILAGGKNSRMGGEDKAFLIVDGRPVFERTLGLLQRCFPQVVVVSNRPEKYRAFDVEVTSDELPGHGPLGGIHAGLGLVRAPYAFVVACDMPFLRVEPIRYLIDRLRGQGAMPDAMRETMQGTVMDAIIPEWEGDIEPLHALYATRLRPAIARAIARGARAIRHFLPEIRVAYVPEAEMRAVTGAAEAFRNVNTPEEAARFAVRRRAER